MLSSHDAVSARTKILCEGYQMHLVIVIVVTMESKGYGVHEPEEEACCTVWIVVPKGKAEPACSGIVYSLHHCLH